MFQTNSISTTLSDEIITTIESIGVERTIKALKDAKLNSLILGDVNIDFVLSSVSEVTGVTKERILNGSDRTDERKIATALCVFLIKTEFMYSYSDLKKIFNKDESALSRYHCMVVENRSSKKMVTDFDKTLDKHFKKINLLFIEKKNTNGK